MQKEKLLVLIYMFVCYTVSSQNFIPNGSFENYAGCPQARNDGRTSYSWDTPTKGTSDYFNSCATRQSQLSIPDNFAGSQAARSGNAYAGFYASQDFTPPYLEYREYMQVTLDSFLVAGGTYSFEMYLSLGDNSNYASGRIGAYISAAKINSNTDNYLNYTPQIVSTSYITDKKGWTKVSGTYIAKGGEHYITIGVFEPAISHRRIDVTGGSSNPAYDGVSYYYLDDVSMTRSCDLPQTLLPADTLICADLFAPFTIYPEASPATTFLWNTGDTTSYLQATVPGRYTLKATSPYCSVYDTVNIRYSSKPSVKLGNDTTICNRQVMLKPVSSSTSTYLWSTSSTDSSIVTSISGKYWIRAGMPGCYASDTINVSLINLQPFSLGGDRVICSGTEAVLTIRNNMSASFRWSTGETSSQIQAGAPGIYWAEAYQGGCSLKDSVKISIVQTPDVSLGNDTSVCFNQPLTVRATGASAYIWNDGSSGNALIVSKPGTYWVKAANNQCTSRDSIVISQKPVPVVDLGTSRAVCAGTTVSLDAGNPGTAFIWSTGYTGQAVSVNAPGVFYVTVTNAEGCYASDTITIDTFTSPVVSLGKDSIVCEGTTLVLDPGKFTSYKWQDGTTQHIFIPHEAGIYHVTVTDIHGCTAADTLKLLFYPRPNLSLTSGLSICEPDTFVTAFSSASHYLWSDGTTSASFPIRSYGTFSVTVTDSNSCTHTAAVEVTSSCMGDIYVPNAFTPLNRDGINDLFVPVGRNITSMHLFIYNRWGELLFESNNSTGWDGTFRSQSMPADVYVYRINYISLGGYTGTLHGNVTLLK
jgi:gliding motility-associated-like protein